MRWPWSKREEQRDLFNVGDGILWPNSYAGVSVTPESSDRHSAVWRCKDLLASTVSQMPRDCFSNGQPIEPLPQVLRQPSAVFAWHDWAYAVMQSLLTYGNCYGDIVARSGATGLPLQVELLDPPAVALRFDERGRIECRLNGKLKDYNDLWHVRAFPRAGQLEGLSPIDNAKQDIARGLAAGKMASQFFGQGGVPTGVISFPLETSIEQARKFRASWDEEHTGADRPSWIAPDRRSGYRTAFIGGGATYQQVQVTPNEAQFLETIKANVADVCRFFGVPPEMVAGEAGNSLTYENVGAQALHFQKYGVSRWLTTLDEALSRLVPRPWYCKLKPEGLLRATTLERYQAYNLADFMTVNEKRALENMPPIAGGNVLPPPKKQKGSSRDDHPGNGNGNGSRDYHRDTAPFKEGAR